MDEVYGISLYVIGLFFGLCLVKNFRNITVCLIGLSHIYIIYIYNILLIKMIDHHNINFN